MALSRRILAPNRNSLLGGRAVFSQVVGAQDKGWVEDSNTKRVAVALVIGNGTYPRINPD
jgi:hypothetical protein